MTGNLHPYLQMVKKAMADGTITRDEKALMESVSRNYGIYLSSLSKAQEEGAVGEEEVARIKELRKRMYEEVLKTALEDGKITDDERAILNILQSSVELDDATLKLIEENVKRSKGEG